MTYIDATFPEQQRTSPNFAPGEGMRYEVAGLMALIDALSQAALGELPPEDQRLWILAVVAVREVLNQWSVLDYQERRLTGGPTLRALATLGNRHPIAVLHDLAAKCPDDAVTAPPRPLTFLGDAALEETLELDISTARSALANGEFKAASVMAGSVIEALLLWAVQRKPQADVDRAADVCRQSKRPVRKGPVDEWGLADLLWVAGELGLLTAPLQKVLEPAKDFRNLIHPGRVQRTRERPTLGTATLAVGAMTRLLEHLNP